MHIFLTGATGLIGGEMAARLVAAGHAVTGLVRNSMEIRSNDGHLLKARSFGEKALSHGALQIVKGDVVRPGLGLDKTVQNQLRSEIDMVIHCAAITGFDATPEQYEAINVDGTRHVRTLFPNTRFLHVSTAYVCGRRDGIIEEELHDAATLFANGYEASKAKAESVVMASGGDVVIARPSIVVGAHACGTIRSFDTIYALFRLIAEGHISALPVVAHATLDFVPIDHVAGGLMDIVEHWSLATGRIFHLASNAPVTPHMLADAIGAFAQLDRPGLISADRFSLDDMPVRQRRIYRRTTSHYAGYFQRNPRFMDENLRSLSGRICAPVDQAALKRMIEYCIKAGFLRAARTSQ